MLLYREGWLFCELLHPRALRGVLESLPPCVAICRLEAFASAVRDLEELPTVYVGRLGQERLVSFHAVGQAGALRPSALVEATHGAFLVIIGDSRTQKDFVLIGRVAREVRGLPGESRTLIGVAELLG